jgi:hypothetical protein
MVLCLQPRTAASQQSAPHICMHLASLRNISAHHRGHLLVVLLLPAIPFQLQVASAAAAAAGAEGIAGDTAVLVVLCHPAGQLGHWQGPW